MCRTFVLGAAAAIALLGTVRPGSAQGVDLTVFVGRAFPVYDERLQLRPSTPSIPGAEVTVVRTPIVSADGGPVLGAALAFEFGVFGIEGRLDATDVGLEFTGAEYEVRGTQPPFQNLSATIMASEGRFDADRIPLLSLNARVRTPGPVAIVASGGLSYLADIDVTGSIPLTVRAPGFGLPPFPGLEPRLTLRATPGQTAHRFGVNGGAGVRVGARVALMAEARVFYFRDFDLRFGSESGPPVFDDLLAGLTPVRFEPVFVNAQVGVAFRF